MSERRDSANETGDDTIDQRGTGAAKARVASAIHDPARLAALQATGLLDSDTEEVFDRLSRLAVRLLGVPSAFLSLVDADRDFYKSASGFGEPFASARQLTGPTFCHYTITSPGALVIPDTAADPLYRDVPTVRTLGVAAYLGVPIEVDGQRIGSFCAIDTRARAWTSDEVETLSALAASAQRELELRAALARADRLAEEAARAREVVAEEQARATGLLEAMTDAYFVLDPDFRIVAVNAAMERATGLARGTMLGQTLWETLPGTVGNLFEESYRRTAVERTPTHFTHDYSDGRLELVAEVEVYPANGGGIAVFWRDITARVRADAALRESEVRFRNMADAAPVMLWVTEPDGFCSFLSRAWLEFTGQTLAEGLGFGWLDVVHPDDRARAERDFVEANARKAPFRADYRLRRHDGTYRWAIDASAPRFGPSGEFCGYIGSVIDIDERMQLLESERAARIAADEARASAEALRMRAETSEALARQLFTLSPVPKWVYDAETLAFLDVNESAMRHYGYSHDEFLAMTLRDIRPPEDIPLMLSRALAPHPTGNSIGNFRHRTKAGEIIDVEVFLRDVPYDGRRAVVAVLQDVTERRRADEALREATRVADAARDAAEAANAAKSQFLSTMSHELRTPLHAIGGYTDLLILGLRGSLNEAQQQDLKRVRLANQHLMALVTDVLNFARLEAGQLEYQLSDVELASIVADLEPLIGPQLVAKRIAFGHDACASDTPDRPRLVRADPEKLRQILLNLLSNAVKFTESGGRVSIACETDRDARTVRVRVRDTGRGIAADQFDRIFEPFVQVDRHRTPDSQQGVGLGLAISRDLARAMSGDLTVASTPGMGSTFTLTLPMA